MAYKIIRTSDSVEADFVTLDPENPNTASHVPELLSRPNRDGIATRKLARKGDPYRWRGFRNFKNIYSARAAIDELRDAIRAQLISVDTNTQVYQRLMVLDVREVAARSIVVGVGGLTTTTAGLWGSAVGSSTVPAIAIVEILVVHVGDAPPPPP